MDLPADCTVARGTYTVRPVSAGMGLCRWLCTLRATYTVRGPVREGDQGPGPRRVAWLSFLALLRLRMAQSQIKLPPDPRANQNPPKAQNNINKQAFVGGTVGTTMARAQAILKSQDKAVADTRNAWLVDFSFDEGLYLDSKTTSFSATWRMVTPFNHILLNSGIWTKLEEKDGQGNNLWATSVRNINGAQSWLANKFDPKFDVIVDFGGP